MGLFALRIRIEKLLCQLRALEDNTAKRELLPSVFGASDAVGTKVDLHSGQQNNENIFMMA